MKAIIGSTPPPGFEVALQKQLLSIIANHSTKLEFSTVNRVEDSKEIGQVYTAPIREGNSTEIDSVFT